MNGRILLKSGDEYDGLTRWRHVMHWNSGQLARIKRGYNKRVRRLTRLSLARVTLLILILTASVSAGDALIDSDIERHGTDFENGIKIANSFGSETRPILRIDTTFAIGGFDREWTVISADTTYVDTTRYYAKVDTVCAWLMWDVTPCLDSFRVPMLHWDQMKDSIALKYKVRYDTDTTWLPKVQVWLMPAQLEKLMEVVE